MTPDPAGPAPGTFAGTVAVVTGAASGIGAASARRLRSLGATVVATDVATDALRAVADECGAIARVLDVADPDAWTTLIAETVADHGGIDHAHLNAGVFTRPHPYAVRDVTVADYRRVTGVNLDGMVLPVLALAPVIGARRGSVVCTASLAGLGPYYDDPVYAATKHAVVAFVRSAAPQLAADGLRLHAVCPGGVRTALISDWVQERIDARATAMLDPAEVAEAVAALLADPSTGTVRTIIAGRGLEEYDFDRGIMPAAD